MRPAAVIFDMDGLLLDTERVARDAFAETCAGHGLLPPPGFFERMVGLNNAASRRVLAEFLGNAASPELFEKRWDDACDRVLARGMPVKTGVETLLAALAEASVPLAVATSTRESRALWKLREAGLHAYFDRLAFGDEVAAGKPAPDIFLLAAARLNAAPATCIAFEDSLNGVLAANAAGMRVVHVPDQVPPCARSRAAGPLEAETVIEGAVSVGLCAFAPDGALRVADRRER
ncbi:MAG: HAD family phosphatase [Pseudomonadota bacterium]